MNIGVMKVFCDLVDAGSFSRAAEINGISQSAVSQQVARLEHDLGTRLVTRGGGLATATDAGLAFYRGAKEILRRYEQMRSEIRSARDAVRGILRVGTIYSVGFYLLNPYIRRFLRAHPDVNLEVEYARSNRIAAAVLSGEMDLGIVAFPARQRSLEIIHFATEELVMVCSPEHPMARRKQIEPADLKGQKLVAFEPSLPTRRYIDRLLKSCRVAVEVAMEFDNIETLKRAVEINAGLSILPRGNVEREVAEGHLCMVPFRDPARWMRRIGIIRRAGRSHSRAEMMFLQVLRSPA